MIKDNKIFFLAFLIFILPLLGLPLSWRFGLIMFFALCLMVSTLDFKKVQSSVTFPRDTFHKPHQHDAHEQMIVDVSKPIKRSVYRSRKKPKSSLNDMPVSESEIQNSSTTNDTDISF